MSRSHHDSPYRDDSHREPSSQSSHRQSRARQAPSGHRTRDPQTSIRHAESSTTTKSSTRRRAGRRSRRGSPYAAQPQLTSHPTGRAAYADTRAWLLEQHGPVCAYCGDRFPAGSMTLDHVAPRRGQTAYDRRDNLVLACQGCNAAKRDLAPAAFLLARRSRAANLLRFGSHLSPMLVDLARSLAPEELLRTTESDPFSDLVFDDGESPYKD